MIQALTVQSSSFCIWKAPLAIKSSLGSHLVTSACSCLTVSATGNGKPGKSLGAVMSVVGFQMLERKDWEARREFLASWSWSKLQALRWLQLLKIYLALWAPSIWCDICIYKDSDQIESFHFVQLEGHGCEDMSWSRKLAPLLPPLWYLEWVILYSLTCQIKKSDDKNDSDLLVLIARASMCWLISKWFMSE